MSSYHSSKQYFSPVRAISDQKDLIISQLKADIFELRQQQVDYHDLAKQFKNIEQRYHILQEEKGRTEKAFYQQNQQNIRGVSNVKNDIDSIQGSIKEKQIEIHELKADNVTLSELAQHRSIEIQRLKSQINQQRDENERQKDQREILNVKIQCEKDEKRKIQSETNNTQKLIDECNHTTNETERNLRDVNSDINNLDKHNNHLMNQQANLKQELKHKQENLVFLDDKKREALKTVQMLQREIQDLEAQNERIKVDIQHITNNCQNQINKNQELNDDILHLKNKLTLKERTHDDLLREINLTKEQNSDNVDLNVKLSGDIEQQKNHIDHLNQNNADLVLELDRLNEQDEQARKLINRYQRVKDLKMKYDINQRNIMNKITEPVSKKRSSPGKNFSSSKKYEDSPDRLRDY